MTLLEKQAEFMRAILDEGAPLPEGWGNSHALGLSVYRGNYRSALMGTLESSFEHTAAYVGEGPFKQAAINHLITHPPAHWTIDAAGEGFYATCAKFFRDNPEVAELAWLEWAMLELATAPDVDPLTSEDFAAASAEFGDEQWLGLSLTFQPRANAREVSHDLTAIWQSLGDAEAGRSAYPLEAPAGCLVWREGERPTFQMVSADNARAFAAVQNGARYGDLIGLLAGDEPDEAAIQSAAQNAGMMLGGWLSEGMIVSIDA